MKITELFAQKEVTVSCELFPPKKAAGFADMQRVVKETAAIAPDYISVTYGAGGGVSQNTVRIASDIQREGVTALAHLTCVSSTRDQVETVLDSLKENNIQNILALRGDIPKDSKHESPDHYRYAYELVREIRNHGDFCIGAACYPEGHVECEHKEEDIDHLKKKVDCGCDFMTTQMFFDNNILYNFMYRILAKGINVPVVAGIMPVTNSKQIRRITALSGTQLPPRFRAIVDKFSDRPQAMEQAGIAYATEQIIDLVANGVKAIHVYTMNRPEIAGKIFDNLSQIVR